MTCDFAVSDWILGAILGSWAVGCERNVNGGASGLSDGRGVEGVGCPPCERRGTMPAMASAAAPAKAGRTLVYVSAVMASEL